MLALSQRVAIIALGGAACIIFYLKYPRWWKRVLAEESGSKQEDIEMAGSNTSAELSFIAAHQNGGESVDGPSSNTEMGDNKDLVQCGAVVWKLEGEDRFTAAGGREVSEEEIQRILDADSKPVPEYWRNKYINEARRMWDVFYKLNGDRFFKDRHYLDKEWEELRPGSSAKTVLEVGCGVGNTTLPLLGLNPELQIWCCDFSDNAIEILRKKSEFDSSRCTAFVSDITRDSLSSKTGVETMDLSMMIFVLSAIAPAKMLDSLRNIATTLRTGGIVLFRDYALYDMAQLKMAEPRKHKISENFYVRGDGTSAYYFKQDELISLFKESGFDVLSCELHRRAVVNRKEGTTMHRRWIQARFVKR